MGCQRPGEIPLSESPKALAGIGSPSISGERCEPWARRAAFDSAGKRPLASDRAFRPGCHHKPLSLFSPGSPARGAK